MFRTAVAVQLQGRQRQFVGESTSVLQIKMDRPPSDWLLNTVQMFIVSLKTLFSAAHYLGSPQRYDSYDYFGASFTTDALPDATGT